MSIFENFFVLSGLITGHFPLFLFFVEFEVSSRMGIDLTPPLSTQTSEIYIQSKLNLIYGIFYAPTLGHLENVRKVCRFFFIDLFC